jgi:hypothetical protein
MQRLHTWSGKRNFTYSGTPRVGTHIVFGSQRTAIICSHQYAAMREEFRGRIVPVGTSRTNPPNDSLGAWLRDNVSRTALASYVAPILVRAGWAQRESNHELRFA